MSIWCLPSSFASPQSDSWFRRWCRLKNFKMVAMAAILNIGTDDFSNSESLCRSDASIMFRFNTIYGLGGDVVWRISICGGHLWYRNGLSLAILNYLLSSNLVSKMPAIKILLYQTYGMGGDVVWRISRWPASWMSERNDFSNSEYITPIPPTKFRLNLKYSLRGDTIWRISRRPPWWPSWISERKNFSNSESLCDSDAFHQVSAQSNLRFGRRRCLINFKMAAVI